VARTRLRDAGKVSARLALASKKAVRSVWAYPLLKTNGLCAKTAPPERVAQCARSIRSFKTRAVEPPRQAGGTARDEKTAATEAAGCTINPADGGKWNFWYSREGEGST
jgi:hypothetical protein